MSQEINNCYCGKRPTLIIDTNHYGEIHCRCGLLMVGDPYELVDRWNTRTEDKRIEKALECIEKTMKIIHDSSCFDAEIIAVKALLEINTIKSILKGEA